MHKQPLLKACRAPSRLTSWLQCPSNTPTETFLHSAADTQNSASTLPQKGIGLEIKIIEPTLIKALGRLLADPTSEEDESESEDEAESEPPALYAAKAIRHLLSIYQKHYTGKDSKAFTDGLQGFADITPAIDPAT